MQYEWLIALAKEAGVGSPCEAWDMPASTNDGANKKHPNTSRKVGALVELQEVTLRDFARASTLERVDATTLLRRCEHLRVQ